MNATIKLGDLIEIERGTTYQSRLLNEPGPVLLGLGSIRRHGGFRGEALKTYGGHSPEKLLVHPGELYASLKDVTQTADILGAVARLPHDHAVGRLTQDTARLDFKSDSVDPNYVYWMLRTSSYREYCRSHATGTTTMGLSRQAFFNFEMPYPSDDRLNLAQLLSALEDKVFHAKIATAGLLDLAWAYFRRAETHANRNSALGSVATIVLGGTPSRTRADFWINGDVPWLASGKANESRVLEPTEWITTEALLASSTKMMPRTATILAITGATLGQIARLEIDSCGNQSLVGIWHEDRAMNDWLYFAIQAQLPRLLRHATGAAQQHVNKNDVEGLEVPVPSPQTLESWGPMVRSLLDHAAALDREALRLTTTRDELLPLLMSGRVSVREAERVVEDAT